MAVMATKEACERIASERTDKTEVAVFKFTKGTRRMLEVLPARTFKTQQRIKSVDDKYIGTYYGLLGRMKFRKDIQSYLVGEK